MEQHHASAPQAQRLPSPVPQDAARRFLLLDCDNRRREGRAEALIDLGVLVDRAAGTVVAGTLWKPGTYDLVLIDLSGADADCATFIAFVQGECPRQKFGFYVAQRPYLVASYAECRKLMHQQPVRLAAAHQAPSAHSSRSPGGTGIAVASRSIAILRRSARLAAQGREKPQAPKVREERFPEISSSDALKLAGRVLGGS